MPDSTTEVLGWEPRTPLQDGLRETYGWIHKQLELDGRLSLQGVAVS
jgi:nucleoside-diphosphate-sugar epimerase